MGKYFKFLVFLILVSCFFVSDVFAAKPAAVYRILFIGNSYTFYNDLPKVLSRMALTAKPKLVLKTFDLTKGGYTLEKFLKEKVTLEIIRKGKFDVVILQEHSTRPVREKKKMHDAVRGLNSEIKKAKSQTVLFMTWAREDLPKMIIPLSKAYIEIGKELDAAVSPAGLAWQNALKKIRNFSCIRKINLILTSEGHILPLANFMRRWQGKVL